MTTTFWELGDVCHEWCCYSSQIITLAATTDLEHVDNEFLDGCGFNSLLMKKTAQRNVALHSEKLKLKLTKLTKNPYQRNIREDIICSSHMIIHGIVIIMTSAPCHIYDAVRFLWW